MCPYISQPYRPQVPGPQLWLYALRSAFVQTPIPDTQGRRVDLAPWPKSVSDKGVIEFVDNKRPEYTRLQGQIVRPDMVVLCTGYTQTFPFLNNEDNANELAYPTPDDTDVRHIWKRSDPTVGFVGFVRPSLGAIPPLAELQTQLWICHLLAPHRIPRTLVSEDEHHYKLRPLPGARITYGVDHETYAYQLAMDMDAAPGLWDIMRFFSWDRKMMFYRLLILWIFGANLNTKFRLQGPWAWGGAFAAMTSDEMWETITRRPILFGKSGSVACGQLGKIRRTHSRPCLGHFAVSILPMSIFGPVNLACWLYECVRLLLVPVFEFVSQLNPYRVYENGVVVKG